MGTTKEPILELKNVKTTFKVPKGILKAVNGVDRLFIKVRLWDLLVSRDVEKVRLEKQLCDYIAQMKDR